MKKTLLLLATLLMTLGASADEGMWLLPLLEKMNGKALVEAGCKLTPEQIYSINHNSLKDAIVHFGGGCTGEIISREGLLVTNHHCGYSNIQALSTPEHNYLMDGYWAMTRKDEIPAPGLTVTFLESMTDVTAELDKAVAAAEKKSKGDRKAMDEAREEARKAIVEKARAAHPGCSVNVRSFYNENVWYLIVSKVYRDVRFVGAPPASIGKFGGETDNWMWPRHTGDFSMFRVYAGKDNEPAEYSEDNVPYVPKQYLKVSLRGVEEGDFAMIMGYPGSTQRFQTAAQLKQMIASNRIRIDARTVRQDLMWEAMCADPTVQLQYANKYAGSANGWKKWQGEELAFDKLDIIGREEQKETAFMQWVGQKSKRQDRYGSALETIRTYVESTADTQNAVTLLTESAYRIELPGFYSRLAVPSGRGGRPGPGGPGGPAPRQMTFAERAEAMLPMLENAYRDYYEPLDRREAKALLGFYRDRAKPENYPGSLGEGFEDFASLDLDAYVNWLFDNSTFTSFDKLKATLAREDAEQLIEADPAAILYKAIMEKLMQLYQVSYGIDNEGYRDATKAFAAGLLEWEKGKPSYPDANSTMRLTYGHVLPYSPKDAVLYRHYTTLTGVMEKEDPTNPEFIVPAKLKELYAAKDFGPYETDGDVRTCFLTNNDITGGNSGSPMLNARGELIGLAFDGNWESMSSDVMFEPALQRCIAVDIRYVLFLVDKLGGAHHLVEEMDLVL